MAPNLKISWLKISWSAAQVLVAVLLLSWAESGFAEEELHSEEDFQTWVNYIHATSGIHTDAASSAVINSSRHHHHHQLMLNAKLLDAERNKTLIVVAQDGTGNFTSIAEAIDSIPAANTRRTVVYIKAGIYQEKILVPKFKPYVTLQGEGNSVTYITWNSTASDGRPLNSNATNGRPLDSNATLPKTFNSATVGVNSKFFVARDITFRNSAPTPNPGESGKQAVALRISGDMAAFYNCNFYGAQDTLYDHKGRHYFRNCLIQGTVDFVFGYGRSLYKDCHLNSIANSTGSLTAQKRNERVLNSGFSFVGCTITGSGNIYLGRAWGDHSRVVYAYTYMEALVLPQGWQNWNDPERNRTVFFGQYECSGPGAKADERVPWAKILTYEEARPFLGTGFIHGQSWLLSAS